MKPAAAEGTGMPEKRTGRISRGIALVVLPAMIAVAAATAIAQAPAQAPAEPSALRGKALADRFCASCHLVQGSSDKPVPAGPPTFRGIANKVGQSATRIGDALILPHPPMPDMQLSRAEILDIVAYLDTLRTDRTTPLLPPPAGAKPKMPSPS